MKLIFNFLVLYILVSTTRPSVYTDLKENILTFLKNAVNNRGGSAHTKTGIVDERKAKSKAKIVKRAREFEDELNNDINLHIPKKVKGDLEKSRYHMDPVLNLLSRRSVKTRKAESSFSSSSSVELRNWQDEWRERWIQKKFEAINSTVYKGDTVNMLAARPWGVPCGDPNQHDMPWGTCMLPMECEAEFRIYRGDYFCGRSKFICCALQLTTYDMYQAMDPSFEDSSLATDSEEKRNRGKTSKERRHRKKTRDKKRRKNERLRRKRKIKRLIKKITKEISKILGKTYRNGTAARKKKTKELKKFIKHLKRQYRKDRKSVKDIHEIEMLKIDSALQKKLNDIKNMNQNYVSNSTFRDIVVNGTMNKEAARMLMEAYPELTRYINSNRRTGDTAKIRPKDYLDYDIEYGLLYY